MFPTALTAEAACVARPGKKATPRRSPTAACKAYAFLKPLAACQRLALRAAAPVTEQDAEVTVANVTVTIEVCAMVPVWIALM